MQSCGRRQLVKGDWRAIKRAPIAAYAVETLDRLPSDLGFTRDREIEDTHIGNSRCAPATKSIQAIKAASDRGLAAFHVLPHSKFKRVIFISSPRLFESAKRATASSIETGPGSGLRAAHLGKRARVRRAR